MSECRITINWISKKFIYTIQNSGLDYASLFSRYSHTSDLCSVCRWRGVFVAELNDPVQTRFSLYVLVCVSVKSTFLHSVGKTVMPCETYVIHSLCMLTEGLGMMQAHFCVCLCCVRASALDNNAMVAFTVAVIVYLKQLTGTFVLSSCVCLCVFVGGWFSYTLRYADKMPPKYPKSLSP